MSQDSYFYIWLFSCLNTICLKRLFFSFELPWIFYNYFNNFQIFSFLCGDLSFYLVSDSLTLIISFNSSYSKCLLVMNFLSFCLSEKFFISLSCREVFLLHVELWVEICFLSVPSLQSLLESLVCGGKPIIIIIFVPICNIFWAFWICVLISFIFWKFSVISSLNVSSALFSLLLGI